MELRDRQRQSHKIAEIARAVSVVYQL